MKGSLERSPLQTGFYDLLLNTCIPLTACRATFQEDLTGHIFPKVSLSVRKALFSWEIFLFWYINWDFSVCSCHGCMVYNYRNVLWLESEVLQHGSTKSVFCRIFYLGWTRRSSSQPKPQRPYASFWFGVFAIKKSQWGAILPINVLLLNVNRSVLGYSSTRLCVQLPVQCSFQSPPKPTDLSLNFIQQRKFLGIRIHTSVIVINRLWLQRRTPSLFCCRVICYNSNFSSIPYSLLVSLFTCWTPEQWLKLSQRTLWVCCTHSSSTCWKWLHGWRKDLAACHLVFKSMKLHRTVSFCPPSSSISVNQSNEEWNLPACEKKGKKDLRTTTGFLQMALSAQMIVVFHK